MKRLLWLDDLRNPLEDDWLRFSPIDKPFEVTWVKSFKEFVEFIAAKGLPDAICFDHDLGLPKQLELRLEGNSKRLSRKIANKTEKSGYDCAKWLVDYCIDTGVHLPPYAVHSFNPVGKANIEGLLSNFAYCQF